MTVLLREAIGDRLRHARTNQRRTLREISRAARVSLGYLSEVERGQKEASSELLASICDALELPLAELLRHVAADMSALDGVDLGSVERATERHTERERTMPAGSGGFEGGRLASGVPGGDRADLADRGDFGDLGDLPELRAPGEARASMTPTLCRTITAPKLTATIAA
ncbi:Transcriptional regulator, contains XRE-family HTH domain [Amycolatopsis arida]|uniref:Transcriptional regulator, contains XRE-family HTH domain n=1 Tax=Amycolatopsis arida TaxID=587909 RepID=A0A1I5VGD2_9PSEU|nr:helix-turn-helix transcriptional regulator [Amycolatopsis arida]TDX87873.1 transcriptional regulator with XRE-family HTH domain [Amycolatopsis arida]SFQ06565.1 Transcriptional regulator, contains XRE-family HTH domain [Amycolatopsis arida]